MRKHKTYLIDCCHNIRQGKARQGVTDELKATNQLEWIGCVNNIVAQIEEIVSSQILYL